jgi:hypothetical protein
MWNIRPQTHLVVSAILSHYPCLLQRACRMIIEGTAFESTTMH